MMNKIKLLIACLLIVAGTAMSQNITPYSMYGYGILGDRATSMQRQMGYVGYAMSSGRQINVMNPASYAAIDSLTFLFDIGANMSVLWSKEGDKKDHSFGGGLDYVTMQFPVSKHIGMSVGLVPYSSVGYAFGNEIEHGAVENQGSGGINEVYVGIAGEFKGFSLGANISYDFGEIVSDVFAQPTGQGQMKYEHVMKVRDWNIVLGAQYQFRFNRFDRMTLGVTYSPKKTLLGTSWMTSQHVSYDTQATEEGRMSLRNNYYMPNAVGAGVSFRHEKASRWMAEFDFTWQGWKDCKFSALYKDGANPDKEGPIFQGMEFNDRLRFAAGGEYTPKIRGNYGERMTYRVGAYYTKDYLKIQGNSLHEYGATCGVGFPTPEGKTMVNLGLEWKHRAASPNALITENYLMINLGVNFNEVWFFKRKIR